MGYDCLGTARGKEDVDLKGAECMRKQQVISLIASIFVGAIANPSSMLAIRVSSTRAQRVDMTNRNGQRTSSDIPTQGRFLLALVAAHVPGGSVWIRQCSGQEPVFHQDQTILPLSDALDSITRVDPRYRWQIDKGVVNLIPRTGEPAVLKVRIKQYRTKTTLNEALRQLLRLPEVKTEAARIGLKITSGGLLLGPSPYYGGPSEVSVDVKDLNLREALNALVRAHGRAIWEYREYRCGGTNEFSIDFVAQ